MTIRLERQRRRRSREDRREGRPRARRRRVRRRRARLRRRRGSEGGRGGFFCLFRYFPCCHTTAFSALLLSPHQRKSGEKRERRRKRVYSPGEGSGKRGKRPRPIPSLHLLLFSSNRSLPQSPPLYFLCKKVESQRGRREEKRAKRGKRTICTHHASVGTPKNPTPTMPPQKPIVKRRAEAPS
jgi:hypothetical protein